MIGTPILFTATENPESSRRFYENVLGFHLISDQPHALVIDVGGITLRIQKVERVPKLPYTVLGWEVTDILQTVANLRSKGVEFEVYEHLCQDHNGIWSSPGSAKVAWFKDPDGNTSSITQYSESESA
jgi:catechol 2,3-dioxygenase-like lactoylglutathione lyase family enzyme